jgi:hypothetical protein
VRYVAFGDDWLPRVEMTLRTPSGDAREVHLYEVYWAPLTEGKVTLSDVFVFLLGAGARGIAYSLRGAFDRWMFGTRQTFALPARGLFRLATALVVVCALALGYVAFSLLAIAQVIALLYPALPGEAAVAMLGRATGWCGLVIAMLGAAGLASTLLTGSKLMPRPSVAARTLASVAAAATVVAAMTGSALIVARWAYPIGLSVRLGVLAAGAILLALVRWFMVQLVGDVAVYVSAHEASRFNEIRRQIQAIGRRVARHVYGSRLPNTGELEYGDIILVGHSLGSVIAYDTLNDAINGDLLAARARSSNGAGPINVAARTKLLLTLGSPLDKTAFLFRTQKDDAPVREALAAAVQPSILRYEHRPARWINVWSPFDWVSGSLEYYDQHPMPPEFARRAVENVRETGVPLDTVRAHLGYWKRREFGECVYAAVMAGQATGIETQAQGR